MPKRTPSRMGMLINCYPHGCLCVWVCACLQSATDCRIAQTGSSACRTTMLVPHETNRLLARLATNLCQPEVVRPENARIALLCVGKLLLLLSRSEHAHTKSLTYDFMINHYSIINATTGRISHRRRRIQREKKNNSNIMEVSSMFWLLWCGRPHALWPFRRTQTGDNHSRIVLEVERIS